MFRKKKCKDCEMKVDEVHDCKCGREDGACRDCMDECEYCGIWVCTLCTVRSDDYFHEFCSEQCEKYFRKSAYYCIVCETVFEDTLYHHCEK